MRLAYMQMGTPLGAPQVVDGSCDQVIASERGQEITEWHPSRHIEAAAAKQTSFSMDM